MAKETTRGREAKRDKPDFPQVKLITCPLRLSYPFFFDPRENDQGQEVWECDGLVPATKEGDAFKRKLEDALFDVMEKHFGPEDEWPRGRNDYAPKDKLRYVDPDKIPGPGVTEDWTVFRCRSYSPIGVVDADRNEVLNKREVYGGRWARLSITVTVYDNKSKGPAIYLNNVQLLDHDESFGGRPSAESEFDKWDGKELAPGGNRERDRDDRGDDRRGSDREGAREGRDGGSRDRRGSRDDGPGRGSAGAREGRDEGRSDREPSSRRGDTRRDDEGPSDRDSRGSDRGRRDAVPDRDRGARGDDRDRGSDRDGGRGSRRDEDDRRGSREEGRGASRDRDGGRDDRDRDAGSREDRRPSRDAREGDRGRGRGSEESGDPTDDDWS